MAYYAGWPTTTHVGYCPEQPVAYSHAQHVGELGLDCRYCHNTVEDAAFAAVPPTATCMNCHATIATSSRALLPIQQSAGNGNPVPWVRVHDLPDFVYFPHNVHVSNGVGCDCCHGRIDRMDRVYQVESLDMGWCLDCHRDPGPRLRPQEFITTMDWVAVEDPARLRSSLLARYNIPEHASTDCSTCHR